MSTIPFDDIVPGATVRFTIVDGKQYMSIRDIIMHMCGMENKRAAEVWDRLTLDQKKEVSAFCGNLQFPGPGQKTQPVITFPGALKLMMFLPGENAKKNRSAMSTIMHRYFAGDPSLLGEIESNANSNHPMAQMARASLETPAFTAVSAPTYQDQHKITNGLARVCSRVSQVSSAVTSLVPKVNVIGIQISSVKTNLYGLSGNVTTLAKAAVTTSDTVKKTNDILSAKNENQTSMIRDLNKQLRDLQGKNGELRQQKDKATNEAIKAKDDAIKAKDDALKAERLFTKAAGDIKRLRAENSALENENKRLKVEDNERHNALLSAVDAIARSLV